MEFQNCKKYSLIMQIKGFEVQFLYRLFKNVSTRIKYISKYLPNFSSNSIFLLTQAQSLLK